MGSDLCSFFKLTLNSFLFAGVRSTFLLFRYDKLMYLVWRRFLYLSLNYVLFFVCVRCFIFVCYSVLM